MHIKNIESHFEAKREARTDFKIFLGMLGLPVGIIIGIALKLWGI